MKLLHEAILSITPKSEMNGCGPKGFGWLVPDKYGRVDFTKAGDIHDACYYWIEMIEKFKGKPLRDIDSILHQNLVVLGRKYADEVFEKNLRILNKTKSKSKILGYLRVPIIKLYYQTVRGFGGLFLRD
jgi:hypothetical protein